MTLTTEDQATIDQEIDRLMNDLGRLASTPGINQLAEKRKQATMGRVIGEIQRLQRLSRGGE